MEESFKDLWADSDPMHPVEMRERAHSMLFLTRQLKGILEASIVNGADAHAQMEQLMESARPARPKRIFGLSVTT